MNRLLRPFADPNPIVRMELLAVLRTPLYVRAVVVSLVALALAVVTGALGVAESGDPSEAGKLLFQVFFGGVFLVMAVVGPAFGATSLVHERESRTWDALALSALGPRRIVAGKLAAVFVAMAFIPVVSLPMLGVAMLFGGVSLAHVLVSAAWVLALGAVFVAFGVAVSAVADSTRKAVAFTVPAALAAATALGSGLTGVGHELARRHALAFEGPFFFADAYLALPFDRDYALWLVAVPAWALAAPAWLAYAVALGGLMDATEHRGAPLQRWALGAPAITLALTVVGNHTHTTTGATREAFALAGMTLCTLACAALLFALVGAPLRETARMRAAPVGALSRTLLPPTRAGAVAFVVALALACNAAVPMALSGLDAEMLLVGAWGTAWTAALAGLVGWLATRDPAKGPTAARVWGTVAVFVTSVAPWLVVALTGLHRGNVARHPPLVLALSPAWAVYAAGEVFVGARGWYSHRDARGAFVTGAVFYAALAAVLLTATARAARRAQRV